jgi:methylenetetrahydrofolate dehydrogenase (NADP+)/methenyltetrahydrofolate cyclohydrolase
LLEHYQIPVKSKNITVIGKSRLVGFPTATILAHSGATITLCHRETKNLREKSSNADILIVAAGVKHLIGEKDIQEGAILIDVGIHVENDGKITGDIHPDAQKKSSFYSPVPGGVGPMTVAALIENSIRLFAKKEKFKIT